LKRRLNWLWLVFPAHLINKLSLIPSLQLSFVLLIELFNGGLLVFSLKERQEGKRDEAESIVFQLMKRSSLAAEEPPAHNPSFLHLFQPACFLFFVGYAPPAHLRRTINKSKTFSFSFVELLCLHLASFTITFHQSFKFKTKKV